MRQALKLHPDSQCSAVTRIEVVVMRPRADQFVLRYVVSGRTDDLRLPPPAAPARTDELWQHTCFEAFVRPSQGDAYYEFNFASSTQWAAYRFDGYRRGMRVVSEISAPCFDVRSIYGSYEFQLSLDLDRLSDLPLNSPWYLGFSAVIEETSGRKSYWALAHPPGKADFHHPDGFAVELARPD